LKIVGFEIYKGKIEENNVGAVLFEEPPNETLNS
jgi:hypothetical protein